MTRKAYARFLVKICARSAMIQGAGPPALLADIARSGRSWPTDTVFAGRVSLLCTLLPETLRMRLFDRRYRVGAEPMPLRAIA